MVRKKRRSNKVHSLALLDAAKEEALYWRFRREAFVLELRAKGLPVPDINTIDMSDSPLLSGALHRMEMESDRIVKWPFFAPLKTFYLYYQF
jgi:hypothetical protein